MRGDFVSLVVVPIFLASSPDLSARTWTDAKSGRTLEGDYVESDGDQVTIKSGDRTLTIKIGRLSDADKTFIKNQSAEPAGKTEGVDRLARLTPPASLKTKPIKGSGKDRKSEVRFTNESGKEVTGFVLQLLFLEEDGSIGGSVPHTNGISVDKGESETIGVSSFFMEDDTASIGAQVSEITFADGSVWPTPPATPPARNGAEPVGAIVIGVIGGGDAAEPAAAFHNYDKKGITSISYQIKYLDGGGKVLDTTSYGYAGGDDPILPAGEMIVITGGDGPPEGAVDAEAKVSQVTFADGSEWSP